MKLTSGILALVSVILLTAFVGGGKNTNPLETELITSDIDNFWQAFDASKPSYDPAIFKEMYIAKGSKGVKGFMNNRIQNEEHLAKIVKGYAPYYSSIMESTQQISYMKPEIIEAMVKLKELYPESVFPPIYFVVGALNSGGTTSRNGLIIGAEMYGLTPNTPKEALTDWLRQVLKPVDQIPHIVAHEVVHFQQKYDGKDLLSTSIKEGSADFIAELISGNHINQHVHDFANSHEKELWIEFEQRMHKKDYSGWLYSSQEGRPNDLGYWMGYKITKAYYDQASNKEAAIQEIMHIKDFNKFLDDSGYADKF